MVITTDAEDYIKVAESQLRSKGNHNKLKNDSTETHNRLVNDTNQKI